MVEGGDSGRAWCARRVLLVGVEWEALASAWTFPTTLDSLALHRNPTQFQLNLTKYKLLKYCGPLFRYIMICIVIICVRYIL